MSNLEKLPSGSYRYKKMIDGKLIRVTFDHKPTENEITLALVKNVKDIPVTSKSVKKSFAMCCESYISAKSQVLSPSTIKAYRSIINAISSDLLSMPIDDISQLTVQQEVNRYAADHTPKTTNNFASFIITVIAMFRPDTVIRVSLPQKIKKEPYIPTDDDVKAILNALKDTEYEVPILLACFGMRRSEIIALTLEDIEGDIVHITKALVENEKKQWVLSTTKTYESTRDITIPQYLIDKIKEKGYIYNGHPGNITKHLALVEKELGIQHFTLHKLRHYFVTKLSESGVPEADILRLGGYSSDRVMKTVYRHSRADKDMDANRKATSKISDTLF